MVKNVSERHNIATGFPDTKVHDRKLVSEQGCSSLFFSLQQRKATDVMIWNPPTLKPIPKEDIVDVLNGH